MFTHSPFEKPSIRVSDYDLNSPLRGFRAPVPYPDGTCRNPSPSGKAVPIYCLCISVKTLFAQLQILFVPFC